ncbi:hypothetical protein POTOM_015649 [Populus tomentosa]|uniref:K-box domain-containing protein n=1 Tax=Populus tomentosa TaxID=118781 RepID=A0A8X8A290_POPTO|nr:hypothetical protein POTOM_015649 [Populus tomentosa]
MSLVARGIELRSCKERHITRLSMESILERYERCSYLEQQLVPNGSEHQESWSLEHPKLMARVEILQRNLRNYTGQELDPLSLKELQYLEQQIDTALKRIRSRKNQLIHESLNELRKKEKELQEQNNILAEQVKENEKSLTEQAQWEQRNLGQNSSSFMPPVVQPPLQPPMPPHPPLTIGDSFQIIGFLNGNENVEVQTPPSTMPSWMLRHVNDTI